MGAAVTIFLFCVAMIISSVSANKKKPKQSQPEPVADENETQCADDTPYNLPPRGRRRHRTVKTSQPQAEKVENVAPTAPFTTVEPTEVAKSQPLKVEESAANTSNMDISTDLDDIKKGIIYSEILRRPDF